MRVELSLLDIQNIKRELTRLLPEVKSSHRAEAMARGLGWQTNAALRAELTSHTSERTVDERAFTKYLIDHGFSDTLFDALGEAVVCCKSTGERNAIKAVLVKEVTLTKFGFGVYTEHTKSDAEVESEVKAGREEMLRAHSVIEFMKAREFLSQFSQRATINKSVSSYGLKHRAEAYHRALGSDHPYVANGLLIAAAIDLGFKIKREGPNAYLNIGSRMSRRI